MKEIDCAYVDESDLVALYLAGRLLADEAEAFEAHFLGCPECSTALENAAAIRVGFGKPALVRMSVTPPRKALQEAGTLLAAAAAVAMIGLGLRQMVNMPPPEPAASPVLRGESADSLDLRITPGSYGEVVLEWPPHPEAQTYRVDVLRTDGVRVLRSETPDNRVELNAGALPPAAPGVSFLVRIEALNPLGQVVARSKLAPLSPP